MLRTLFQLLFGSSHRKSASRRWRKPLRRGLLEGLEPRHALTGSPIEVTAFAYEPYYAVFSVSLTQPITEEQLLTGPLEPTNEWYAVAKIAGLMQLPRLRRQHGRDFISAMP